MFENIHFLKLNPAELFMDDNSEKYWYSSDGYHSADDTAMYTDATNADYSMSRSIQLLPLRPVSRQAKEHYLYLQSFGILQADGHYYTKRENYDSFLLLFTYSGAGYLEYDGKEYYLNEGDGFLIDCMKPHFYRTDGNMWHHSVLHFNGIPARHFFQLLMQKGSVTFSSEIVKSYQHHIEKLLTIYSTTTAHMELQISNEMHQLLTDIIIHSDSAASSKNALSESLQYLIKYMDNNFNASLSLDYLARFSGISKYHLCREFKKFTGFTPNDYLIRLRIEHAKFYLHNTSLSVAKIAQLIGIPDENNFNYHFKKRVGMTPGRFRILS